MNQMPQHIYPSIQKAQSLTTDAWSAQRSTSWPSQYIQKPNKRTCPCTVELNTGVKHAKCTCTLELGPIAVLINIIQKLHFGDNSLYYSPKL